MAQDEKYGEMLKKVEEHLGKREVKSMAAYLKNCAFIKRNKYDDIIESRDPFQTLVDIMTDNGQLSKDTVELLLDVLRKNSLIKASQPLLDYRSKWLGKEDVPDLPDAPTYVPGSADLEQAERMETS